MYLYILNHNFVYFNIKILCISLYILTYNLYMPPALKYLKTHELCKQKWCAQTRTCKTSR